MTRRPSSPAYVAANDTGVGSDLASFLENVGEVKALTVAAPMAVSQNLMELRGYDREDLFALAEVGYHYLMNGATDLARIIFEGLTAVDPREAYFALGAGLAADNDDDARAAVAFYRRASQLDPTDARPDINRAELYIAAKDRTSAQKLLRRALEKARARGDMDLFRKAKALLTRTNRMETRR